MTTDEVEMNVNNTAMYHLTWVDLAAYLKYNAADDLEMDKLTLALSIYAFVLALRN